MRAHVLAGWVVSGILGLSGLLLPAADRAAQGLDNAACLGRHGNDGYSVRGADGKTRLLITLVAQPVAPSFVMVT